MPVEDMDKVLTFCFFLMVVHFFLHTSAVAGMTCFNCNDVSSPKHCQQTIVCGQGEICSTRSFIDHHGLHGFHLQCRDNVTCELIQEANSMFGKGDAQDGCYECCAKDECNADLCQMPTGGLLQGTTTHKPPSTSKASTDVTCMSCQGVASPEHCRQTTVCGRNEICFTREYTDHRGLKGFRLGCESQSMCRMYEDAKLLIGKRNVPSPVASEDCYECCTSDECNIALCKTKITTPPLLTTTQATGTPAIKANGCPEHFEVFGTNCYLFTHELRKWSEARSYCKTFGADLLSIHSWSENTFIANGMRVLNLKDTTGFWTGGFYSPQAEAFLWLDGTPFNFTNWITGYPLSSYPDNKHVVLGNPVSHITDYSTIPMWTNDYDYSYGVTCKTPRVV